MKLYVYCFAEGSPSLHKTPRGISGAPVRLIKFEDLSAFVSVCRVAVFPASRKNALAHHEVVRSINKQTTPLPARFGTLVTDQQLRNYVLVHRQALKAKLAHVRGCAEMNVKMIGKIARTDAPQSITVGQELGPGTTFLLKKRTEILNEEAGVLQKGQFSEWLHEKLSDLIKDEQISLVPSHTVILAKADHLIERTNIQEYRDRMARAVAERPEVRLMVSGPWAPYSFANIELEFSKQFGVT